MHRFYITLWRQDRTNSDYLKAITMLNSSLSQLATKLRLAITSVDKRAGILTEVERPPEERDAAVRYLFGGGAVRCDYRSADPRGAMLRLGTRELADRAGVAPASITRAEAVDGVPGMHTHTLQRIQVALEQAGVEFGTDGVPVRMRRRQP